MTREEILRRYRELGELPNPPGERSWVQRVDDETKLFSEGPFVAEAFRDLARDVGRETVRADIGRDCPELFDLLLDAFPKRDSHHG